MIVRIILIFSLLSSGSFLQAALGNITNVIRKGDTLDIYIGADKLEVQVCTPEIVRIDYQPIGVWSPDTMIIGNYTWTPVGASIDIISNPIIISTSKMIVKINKTPCRILFYDIGGNLLFKEQDSEGIYSNGVRFYHDYDHNFYGINGYDAWENSSAGILRNTGGHVTASGQGDCGSPFVWSNKGYGVLVDSDGGHFTIGANYLTFSDCTKTDVEFYILIGTPFNILSGLSLISGKPPMLPKWAMGFTNSEWGIDQNELLSNVNTYRDKNIPIDNYTLDFDWKAWGEDNYGEWRWNTNKFPDGPTGILKTLMDSKGIKLTGIMKPRIHVDTSQGTYASINNLWWPGRQPYIDYFSGKMVNDLNFAIESCRTWFYEHSKDVFNQGIVGWWNDEADWFDNWQFMNMQRAFYEGQRKYSNLRVWSLNRNYYLGAQRYAYALWSGDINTGFNSMANQRERMLTAINLGAFKWGMDTGGFIGTPTSENYARWMQFASFVPIFRVHGTNGEQRQPWRYGTKAEAVVKNAIQLRYALIPYIYSYERKAFETGVGIVTPIIFNYPNDIATINMFDEWMFGDYLLVAPVVNQGETSKNIYLPQGTWIDYSRGNIIEGNQTTNYPINADTWEDLPIFIKKGAIIPSQRPINYVGEKPINTINLSIFPDKIRTEFNYYDDDGITYDYENGVYFKQTIAVQDNDNYSNIRLYPKSGSYVSQLQYYICKVYGRAGTQVTINHSPANKVEKLVDLENATSEVWTQGNDKYGNVTYVKVFAGEIKNISIYSASSITPIISGIIKESTGTALGEVVVDITGIGNIITDEMGVYSIGVNYGWIGIITPSKAGYKFTPPNRSYTNVTSNQANQDYTATAVTLTISGQVKTFGGTGIEGVSVTFSDGGGVATTDASGNYSKTVSYGWTGTAKPSKAGYTFVPSSRSYTNVIAKQTGQDYTSSLLAYAVSGTVNLGAAASEVAVEGGLAGVVMSGLPGNPATDASGAYAANVDYGWSGTVTPSKAGYTFSPPIRTYTNVTSAQVSQDYMATTIAPPQIAISKSKLNFGAQAGGAKTQSIPVIVNNAGGGTLNWTAAPQISWITTTPASGTGNGTISIGVNPLGLSSGSYTGIVSVSAAGATNSPQAITLNLQVYDRTIAPIGFIDTPIDGTTGIEGSVPITGWAVDDVEVVSVKIYRDPVEGEGAGPNGYVYIGDAIFVEGARPDVEQAYPNYPLNEKAGWGYMMLTNFLPNSGNGTFRIHAIATDKEGNTTLLGSKTITCDNASATLPFGAIDIPSQGGTASGSGYINYAWVLATGRKCIPTDGSTITAWVDGIPIGHPSYGYYRVDISTLFPGYCNANGAIGYIPIDTTKYTNGVHTIVWSATDSAGVNNGFGSRYFTIQNSSSRVQAEGIKIDKLRIDRIASTKEIYELSINPQLLVHIKRGFFLDNVPEIVYPDENGHIVIEIRELERLEIKISGEDGIGLWRGFLRVGEELRPLPIGAGFDPQTGAFTWLPGAGFIGEYNFIFRCDESGRIWKTSVRIIINPTYENK